MPRRIYSEDEMNKLVKERMRSHEYFNQRKFDEGNDKSKRKWMANKRRRVSILRLKLFNGKHSPLASVTSATKGKILERKSSSVRVYQNL